MAKKLKVYPIPSMEEGKAIQVPDVPAGGIPVIEGRFMKSRDGTIIDVLDLLFESFPREMLTMANITDGIRMKEQVTVYKKEGGDFLTLEDATYDWTKKMLTSEMVGVKMLGFNLPNVLKVFEEAE